MKRKRTFTFFKEEHFIDGQGWTVNVVKDSVIMKEALSVANKIGIEICNVHFSDWKKCTISARADKDVWLLFCYRLIEKLDGYIERYTF